VDLSLVVEHEEQLLAHAVGALEPEADQAHLHAAQDLEAAVRQHIVLELLGEAHVL